MSKLFRQRISIPRRTTRSRCPQRGATLVELLVAISIGTTFLTILGTLFHFVIRLERQQREDLVAARTMARLADQFREDCRAADFAETPIVDTDRANDDAAPGARSDMVVPVAGTILLRVKDGVRVEYTVQDRGVERREFEQGEIVRREFYRLARDLDVGFASLMSAGQVCPSLIVRQLRMAGPHELQAPGDDNTRRTWRIEGLLAADRRFLVTDARLGPADENAPAGQENKDR